MRSSRGALLVAVVALLSGAACDADREPRATAPSDVTSTPTTAPTPDVQPAPLPPAPLPPAPPPPGPPPPGPEEQARLDEALRDAAWANDVPRAAELIAAGADVDAKDRTQQSAYLIATSEGHLELLELTLRHGADVGSLDRFDGTGLIRAAERGHAPVVGRLLQTPIAVNHVNRSGYTALHEAVIYGDGSQRYVDTVRLLVARGADVGLPSARDGVAPLDHARRRGQDVVAATLTAALAGPPPADPAAALLGAAQEGQPDRLALALRAGASVDGRDSSLRTPLLLAVTYDRLDVARLLVALGADPDALDARHDTPWLVTGVTGSVPMLETLLPAGPDLTIRNRFGGISVIPASERGHVEYVRRVVQTGIDVNHVNDPGWTALLEAVVYGDGSPPYQEIVRILLAAGADRGIRDAEGRTALDHAVSRGQREVAQLLRG